MAPPTTPTGQATVPWHQDNSYLDEECWDKLQVTAWVPLIDTNTNNGCMQVVRRGHTSGVTATHACCVGGTWYTEVLPEELEATLGLWSNPFSLLPSPRPSRSLHRSIRTSPEPSRLPAPPACPLSAAVARTIHAAL